MKSIAIIGATGMLGKPVTQAFVDAGWKVSVLARNEDKARQMFGSSVYPEKFAAERTWKELGEPQISLMDYIRR